MDETVIAIYSGFVYSSSSVHCPHNLFLDLSTNILNHLGSFKKLKSMHIHCDNGSYLSNNNTNSLLKIEELCISLAMDQNGKSILTQN